MILTRWRDLFILNKTVARNERKLIILKKKRGEFSSCMNTLTATHTNTHTHMHIVSLQLQTVSDTWFCENQMTTYRGITVSSL